MRRGPLIAFPPLRIETRGVDQGQGPGVLNLKDPLTFFTNVHKSLYLDQLCINIQIGGVLLSLHDLFVPKHEIVP